MKSLWNSIHASKNTDSLALRVYTSRLLGADPSLVLHGGGNTSVKTSVKNAFGEFEDILYIKGSGWDLATIEKEGFAPVKLQILKRLARFEKLSDDEMVNLMRSAMTNPNAPTPSVEAILHAIIPFTFVDHTHADVVVTVNNTPGGNERIKEIYGKKVLYVPYVMPGFILARKIFEMTQNIDWKNYEGMVLFNHGIFSFADSAKESYERMIKLVSKAENYLKKKGAWNVVGTEKAKELSVDQLKKVAQLRCEVSLIKKGAVVGRLSTAKIATAFSKKSNLKSIASRGPITPDHMLRTKKDAVVIDKNLQKEVNDFAETYRRYFNRHCFNGLTMLDAAPRWAVGKDFGALAFGSTVKEANIVKDIIEHIMEAILRAEKLGGWKALPEKDLFDVEYWSLEQAKLKKGGASLPLLGKVALVTGAASGIGLATVKELARQGAVAVALDIDSNITKLFCNKIVVGIQGDVTDEKSIEQAVYETIKHFGGLDIVVSNAGTFPPSEKIEELKSQTWKKSLDVNLTSHQLLLKAALPFLSLGIDPTVIFVASKNVPAPGPGAAAYSVAKAGVTQLARVAALELAPKGIRVNVVHPNQVFDTAIWTKDVLEKRAKNYGVSVEEYKKSNLLKTEITSKNVAELICAMAGPIFSKTTGAQIPIDGGNERVI